MNYLLDRAKEITGSDRQTALRIGVAPQLISNVRTGHKNLTPYQAAKIAELIGERWSDHALPVLMDQAKTPAEKDYWLKKLEILRTLIEIPAKKAVSLAILMITAHTLALGAINESYHQENEDSQCILC